MINKQIQVIIFYPADSCVCSSEYILERWQRGASHFEDDVDYNMRSIASEEANQYLIKEACVLVNGSVRLTPDIEEEELMEAIVECLNEL